MSTSPDRNEGSAGGEPPDAADSGRARIGQALVRLGHAGLIDPALDPDLARPTPSGRLRRVLWRLRRFGDPLRYQGKAVLVVTSVYVIVSLSIGLVAASGHLIALVAVFGGGGAVLWLPEDREEAPYNVAATVLLAWLTVLVILLVIKPAAAAGAYLVPALVGLGVLAVFATVLPVRDRSDLSFALGGGFRSAPLLAAVLLGLFAVALFNSGLWLDADKLGAGRIAGVVALTLGILLLIVRAHLRGRLDHVLDERTDYLTQSLTQSPDECSDRLEEELAHVASDEEREDVKRWVDAVLPDHWPEQPYTLLAEIKSSERKVLLAPVTLRLVLSVLIVGLIVSFYLYVLAWVAVPADVVKRWTGDQSPTVAVNVGLGHLSLPGAPYVLVAALLGLVATAAFLGSATLDDRIASPFNDSIVVAPVTRFLVLALPYRSMAGPS
jgi:hypothetical protein